MTIAKNTVENGGLHELKTWPRYFQDAKAGLKTFEVRRFDRSFAVHDHLLLKEYDPRAKEYTGDSILREITYILPGGQFGIEPGYCVLGLAEVSE